LPGGQGRSGAQLCDLQHSGKFRGKQQGNMGPRSVARQQQVVLIGLLHVPNTVRGERNKMPYSRFKRGAKYCLRNKRTGKVRCFGSKRKRENWARMAEAIVHGFKPRKKK